MLTIELLAQIRQAEQAAEKMRQDASYQAREILSGMEEALAAQQRQSAVELRGMTQSILEEARVKAKKEIEQLGVKNDKENASLCESAQKKLEQAAQRIVERIVNDGHC